MTSLHRRHRRLLLAAAATVAVAPTLGLTGPAPAGAADRSANRTTVAVIGDVPYGEEQEARFGDLIGAINDDPKVRTVVHVGDIKSGSVTCTDERFAAVRAEFDTFEDPLVYTPGDNEWTDCHRANNGSYNPLERLAAIRELFFSEPGETLGRRPMKVTPQEGLTENVRWIRSRVALATLHVIGSNNGLAAWSGIGFSQPTAEQAAEVQDRISKTIDWVDTTFDAAEEGGLQGVVLMMQADTWSPAPGSAQKAIIDRITQRTEAFDGEVLVIQGDTHTYRVDNPLGLDNFTRIVVHGETLPFEYLRLTIDPRDPNLFSWTRVQVAS